MVKKKGEYHCKSNCFIFNTGGGVSLAVAYPNSATATGTSDVVNMKVPGHFLGNRHSSPGKPANAFGNDATADNSGTAIGSNAYAKNLAFAGGVDSKTEGTAAVAIGAVAYAKEAKAIAIGRNSTSLKESAVAVGSASLANGNRAIALGGSATATGENAIAIGTSDTFSGLQYASDTVKASGKNSIALGTKAEANKEDAIAFGKEAEANKDGGVAIGAASVTTADKGVTGYKTADTTYAGLADNVLKSTHAAVSIGNGTTVTRQLTGLAAGTNDTDAANIAQLKAVMLRTAGDTGTGNVRLHDQTITFEGKNGIKTKASNQKVEIDITTGNLSAAAGSKLSVSGGENKLIGGNATIDLDAATKTAIDSIGNKADQNLSNLTPTGKNTIKDQAREAVEVAVNPATDGALVLNTDTSAAHKTKYTLSLDQAKLKELVGTTNIGGGTVTNNNGDTVTGGTVYNAVTGAKTKVDLKAGEALLTIDKTESTDLNPNVYKLGLDKAALKTELATSLGDTFAKKDASNLDNADVTAWKNKLGVANLDLSYKAGAETSSKTTSLAQGLHFKTEGNLTTSSEAGGVVKFALNETNAINAGAGTGGTPDKLTTEKAVVDYVSGEVGKINTAATSLGNNSLTFKDGATTPNSFERKNNENKTVTIKAEDIGTTHLGKNLKVELSSSGNDATYKIAMTDSPEFKDITLKGQNGKDGVIGVDGNGNVTVIHGKDGVAGSPAAASKVLTEANIGDQTISYRANDAVTKESVKLKDGFNFKNGNNTTASVAANGEVVYDVNLNNLGNNMKLGYKVEGTAATNKPSITDGLNFSVATDTSTTANPNAPKAGLKIEDADNGKLVFGLDSNTRKQIDDAVASTGSLTNNYFELETTVGSTGLVAKNIWKRTNAEDKRIKIVEGDVEDHRNGVVNYKGSNLITQLDTASNTIKIGLKESPEFKDITVKDGITIKGKDGANGATGKDAVLGADKDGNLTVTNGKDGAAGNSGTTSKVATEDNVGSLAKLKYTSENVQTAGTPKQETALNDGLIFKNGKNTTAVTEAARVVKIHVKDSLEGINSISNGDANSTTATKVSITDDGLSLNDKKLAGLANGTDDKDAVTIGQLKDLGIDPTASAADKKPVVTYDSTAKDKITLGDANTPTSLTNLKDGAVNATSKDAVTGKQLHELGEHHLTFKATEGVAAGFTRKNSEDATILFQEGDITVGSDKYLGKNLKTSIDASGNITIGLKEEAEFKSISIPSTKTDATGASSPTTISIGPNGINAGGTTISGVGDAKNGTDAVNKDQLDKAIQGVNSGLDDVKAQLGTPGKDGADGRNGTDATGINAVGKIGPAGKDGLNGVNVNDKVNALRRGEAGPLVYTNADGERVVKAKDGNYYLASDVDRDGNPLPGKTPIEVKNVRHSLVDADGDTTKPSVLGNVADGKIAANSKEAVNGGQLFDVKKNLGLVDANGQDITLTLPGLKGSDGKDGTAPTTIVDALKNTMDTVNKGIHFGGNQDEANSQNKTQYLGSKLSVTATDQDLVKAGIPDKFVGKNLLTEYVYDATTGNGNIKVGLSENPEFKGITVKDPNDPNSPVTSIGKDGTRIEGEDGSSAEYTLEGSKIKDKDGNTATVTAKEISLKGQDGTSSLGDTGLTLKDDAGNEKVKISNGKDGVDGKPGIDFKGNDGSITGLATRDLNDANYGTGNNAGRAATEGALKELADRAGNSGKDGTDGRNGSDTTGNAYGEGKVGPAGKDGLNGINVNDKVNALRRGEAGPVVYTNAAGDRLVKGNDGNYYLSTQVDDKGVISPGSSPVPLTDVRHSLVDADGKTTSPSVLGNVANGKVAKDSKDAVNGGQLFDVKKDLGLVDANGQDIPLSLPGMTKVDGSNGQAPTTVVEGLKNVSEVVNQGLQFGADNNPNGTKQQLGSTLTVESGDFTDGGVQYSGKNIQTKYDNSNGNGKIQVVITESPEFKEIIIKDPNNPNAPVVKVGKDGVTIQGKDGTLISVTSDGINAGGKAITNLGAGEISENSTDAVTGSQVHNLVGQVNNNFEKTAAAIQQVNHKVDRLEERTTRGLATSAAMGTLKFIDIGVNQVTVGAAVGSYRGEQAVAVGVQAAPTENTRIHGQASINPGPNAETMVGVGASWRFNLK